MPIIDHEKSGCGGDSPDPGTSDLPIEQNLELPKSFRNRSLHEVWGPGGPAGLIRRLAKEHELGRLAPLPLTNDELAQLVELYDDEPLPRALRDVLLLEMRNQRRERPGRKANLSASHKLEQLLLPVLYERGTRVACRYCRRLLLIEKRKKRREMVEKIPTHAEVALRYVRKWLPSTDSLNDKTLANKLSAMKDQSDKKPRAKAAKR